MPIRLRLALWYGGLAGLVILLVSIVTYATHTRAHYDDLDRLLRNSTEHIAEEYAAAQTADGRAAVFDAPVAPDVAMRLYDANGNVLDATPNATPAPSRDPRTVLARPSGPPFDRIVRLAPAVISEDPGQGAYGLVTGADGVRWRLYVLPVDGTGVHLFAAAPLDRIDASVVRFRWLVVLLTLAGTAVTLVAAALIAGRALRPVADLTGAAHAIARSRNFRQRVPVGNQKDELGRLGTTFNEMLASLEQAYEAQQRFVGDASHELRAPLTAIQANLELLERRPDMPPAERQEAVAEAARESHRLARLVADLLTLARADAGVPLRMRRIELDRVVMDAFGEARHLVRGQRLEVERLEPAVVEGDPDRLRQLLIILLDNALKYTPPDGRVAVGLQRNTSVVKVTVRDTGVGITPEDLPRVFERFYRADPGRARDPGGTGLGLPIARWIAEQHGGEIALTSEPGHGTTATVRIPLQS